MDVAQSHLNLAEARDRLAEQLEKVAAIAQQSVVSNSITHQIYNRQQKTIAPVEKRSHVTQI